MRWAGQNVPRLMRMPEAQVCREGEESEVAPALNICVPGP